MRRLVMLTGLVGVLEMFRVHSTLVQVLTVVRLKSCSQHMNSSSLQHEQPHWNKLTRVQSSLSTKRPGFAAANQVVANVQLDQFS